jgi:hypothetical protein
MTGPVWWRRGVVMVLMPAVVAVAEDLVMAGARLCDGGTGDDGVVAVARPAVAGHHHFAAVSADDHLGVDIAPVVLAHRADRVVVNRDQGGCR